MSSLGERVKQYRIASNLSVRELARRAEVSVSYIYAVESGARGHHILKLERIAAALGVSVSELWEGEKA